MRKTVLIALILTLCTPHLLLQKTVLRVSSPDKKAVATLILTDCGELRYKLQYDGKQILEESSLGIITKEIDLSKKLKLVNVNEEKVISDSYELICGKKRFCTYIANERSAVFKKWDWTIEVIFRIKNNGFAYRYRLLNNGIKSTIVIGEKSSFKFNKETIAWLHPHRNAGTGWNKTQPSYEEYYYQAIPVGTPAPEEAGWSFPALFKTGDTWLLITESDVTPNYCGSRLSQYSPEGEYFIQFPQREERTGDTASYIPVVSLPVYTPWRAIIFGELKDIVETTWVTDLATPSMVKANFVKPGKASWSWALLKDNSITYENMKKFIDYAADMNWEYCLIDVDWHKRIGYERIKELAEYSKKKNVGLLLWYNSAGGWNTTPYGPRDLLLDSVKRRKEFERISNMGIKGVKVDFWGGDGQSMIKYYFDLFTDAAKYNLMVNCHGTTIPRGWERTFPNLVTMEAVRGFEFVTFAQENADSVARHCTILPFTRNAIGPMDFTPVCFSEIPGIKRRTSNAFELALSVLFQSGIQHFAEIPEGMKSQPDYIVDFFRELPSRWEDIRFIDGYPGKYVVIARKGNKKWYIAGINAMEQIANILVDLSEIDIKEKGILITDGSNNREFKREELILKNEKFTSIILKPNCGFVMVFEEDK